MKDLRDWYSYLERSARVSAAAAASPSVVPPSATPPPQPAAGPLPSGAPPRSRATGRAKRQVRRGRASLQEHLPMDLGTSTTRRPGRPPLTETREEIIQRLLDPDLSVHEASAILRVSKATLRRYTDSGKLACVRTAGGQRRFKLSAVLALLEGGGGSLPAR